MKSKAPFAHLSPDTVLDCAERALDRSFENICRPHSSYINRVFELQDRQGDFFVAKFYRPGRWSSEAIGEELAYVNHCDAQEIPVVPPRRLSNGALLDRYDDIFFTISEKCGGRIVDEYSDEQVLELGRLIGRVHLVGQTGRADNRPVIHPLHTTQKQLAFIKDLKIIPSQLEANFLSLAESVIATIAPCFSETEMIRIHGDCHRANLIHRPGESFYLIDFDDMAVGPPIQDLWMLLPGTLAESGYQLELLLAGYETFKPFDRSSLKLIEPLRAMRYLHYISWCAWQYVEDGQTLISDRFGSYDYWQQEIADLQDQLAVIGQQVSC